MGRVEGLTYLKRGAGGTRTKWRKWDGIISGKSGKDKPAVIGWGEKSRKFHGFPHRPSKNKIK